MLILVSRAKGRLLIQNIVAAIPYYCFFPCHVLLSTRANINCNDPIQKVGKVFVLFSFSCGRAVKVKLKTEFLAHLLSFQKSVFGVKFCAKFEAVKKQQFNFISLRIAWNQTFLP